jgi:hypothetical protein
VKSSLAHELLALDATDTCSQLPNARTIQLPGFPNGLAGFSFENGCISLSCGVLCYAQQELDGCMMRIWSLEGSGRWVVKHRLSMNDVFGRDLLLRNTNTAETWFFDYYILAIDLERELVIVADRIAHMVFSFSISTGKLSGIWIDSEPWLIYYYYVPYYNKFPASVLQRAQVSTIALPDDLVVEILSRLPLKSFCRFKCVCKSWLAFSSDSHYCQKHLRAPVGLLYQKREHGTTIRLAGLPSISSDRDIDTTLCFVPSYAHPLKLNHCSNGLLVCHSGDSNAIVCNPATEEWMSLPCTQPGSSGSHSYLRLGFDPLWSQHFYVFNFQDSHFSEVGYKSEVKVFFSENSTWSSCLWESDDPCWCGSLFVNGVMYMQNILRHDLLALDAPDTCTQLLNERTILTREYLGNAYIL